MPKAIFKHPAPRDSRGVTLRVGQHVAYNRSGDVVTGVVTGVGQEVRIELDEFYWPRPYVYGVPPEYRQAQRPAPSRVKNTRGILVLSGSP